MPRVSSEEKRAYYEELCDRLAASGLTLEAFCKKEGVGVNTLNYWRRKFGRMNSKFRQPRLIEMPFPCGITLVIREGCDPEALRRVLAALEGT